MQIPQFLLALMLLSRAQAASGVAAAAADSAGTPVYPVLCDSRTHGCVRHPPGCRSVHRPEAGLGCNYLAAWRRVGGDEHVGGGDTGVEVAIAGRVGVSGGYVALGFKPSRGGAGTEGVLLACYKTPTGSRVHLRLATYGRDGVRFLSQSPDGDDHLLAEADGAPTFEADWPERAGHFWPLAKLGYGALECRARLRVRRGGTPLEFMLDPHAPLHPLGLLFDGHQPLLTPSGEGLERPTWRYTAPARPIGEPGEVAGPPRTGAAKAHGCMAVLAWVLCASVGVILARYYKLQWPSRLLGKELIWFQMHRALMAACCILTLLSFIVIFADVGGYSGLDQLPDLVHPILGIIVTILTLANPLISLCRCAPGHENRPWFNWIHWFVGTIAYILAVFNLFLGLRLERAGDLRSIDYHIWILIFFVLFQFVIEIVLEVHTLYHWKRNKRRWQLYQQEVLEYQQRQREAALQKPQSRPLEPKPAGYCLRTFLLVLHLVIAAAVALILVVVIIVY